MQNIKIGNIIRQLRLSQQLTQKALADKMNISDKTISKWERGLGSPDISLIPELSNLLGVDTQSLLTGQVDLNESVVGNMKQTKYHVCPTCQNISLCTGAAEVACCGKKLTALTAQKAADSEKLHVEVIEDDWYITGNHPMTKEHYISFVALATGERIQLVKQYPEWDLSVRIPRRGHGLLLWYCKECGLLCMNV